KSIAFDRDKVGNEDSSKAGLLKKSVETGLQHPNSGYRAALGCLQPKPEQLPIAPLAQRNVCGMPQEIEPNTGVLPQHVVDELTVKFVAPGYDEVADLARQQDISIGGDLGRVDVFGVVGGGGRDRDGLPEQSACRIAHAAPARDVKGRRLEGIKPRADRFIKCPLSPAAGEESECLGSFDGGRQFGKSVQRAATEPQLPEKIFPRWESIVQFIRRGGRDAARLEEPHRIADQIAVERAHRSAGTRSAATRSFTKAESSASIAFSWRSRKRL